MSIEGRDRSGAVVADHAGSEQRGLRRDRRTHRRGADHARQGETGWMAPPVYARFSVQLGKMLDEKRIVGTHLAPYLRNVDVQWEGINIADLPEMDFSEEDRERYTLRKGDLLVCEGGEVGRTAIWNGELAVIIPHRSVALNSR